MRVHYKIQVLVVGGGGGKRIVGHRKPVYRGNCLKGGFDTPMYTMAEGALL